MRDLRKFINTSIEITNIGQEKNGLEKIVKDNYNIIISNYHLKLKKYENNKNIANILVDKN